MNPGGDYGAIVESELVRPFVQTLGRTGPALPLHLETLITVVPDRPLPEELQDIAVRIHTLLRREGKPCAIAEILAKLRLSPVVAQVVVADLIDHRLVRAHATAESVGHASVMGRVVDYLSPA